MNFKETINILSINMSQPLYIKKLFVFLSEIQIGLDVTDFYLRNLATLFKRQLASGLAATCGFFFFFFSPNAKERN